MLPDFAALTLAAAQPHIATGEKMQGLGSSGTHLSETAVLCTSARGGFSLGVIWKSLNMQNIYFITSVQNGWPEIVIAGLRE